MFYLRSSNYFLGGQNILPAHALYHLFMVSLPSVSWQQNAGTPFPNIIPRFQILILFVNWYLLLILAGTNELILIL